MDRLPDHIDVDRFIMEKIDSVPQLEALLLLWHGRSEDWSPERLAKRLWVDTEFAASILVQLASDRLIKGVEAQERTYRYQPELRNDALLESLDQKYRNEMVRISTMIHSKASPAVREFARAFRFKKEGD